jgi:hypothetical protein
MLNQLYVKGSLRDAGGSAQFALHNNLANATITGLKLQIDGAEVAPARVRVMYEGSQVQASEISPQRPIRFMLNTGVTLISEGMVLSAGVHRIVVSPTTAELGQVAINAQDELG